MHLELSKKGNLVDMKRKWIIEENVSDQQGNLKEWENKKSFPIITKQGPNSGELERKIRV